MKKKLGIIVSLLVVLMMFVGCGSTEPPIEDWINDSVTPILAETFDGVDGIDYKVEQTGNHEVTVSLKFKGAAELAVYAQDYSTVKETWDELKGSLCKLSTTMIDNANSYGISNVDVKIDLYNDLNEDLILMSVTNGETTYDCVVDK